MFLFVFLVRQNALQICPVYNSIDRYLLVAQCGTYSTCLGAITLERRGCGDTDIIIDFSASVMVSRPSNLLGFLIFRIV